MEIQRRSVGYGTRGVRTKDKKLIRLRKKTNREDPKVILTPVQQCLLLTIWSQDRPLGYRNALFLYDSSRAIILHYIRLYNSVLLAWAQFRRFRT